jgi:hypothetical protein
MCSPLSVICVLLSQGYMISSLRDICSPLSGIYVLLSQGYVILFTAFGFLASKEF